MIKAYLMTGAAIVALSCFSPMASAQSERGQGAKTEHGGSSAAGEQGGSRGSMGRSEQKGGASSSHKSAQGSDHSASGSHKSSANGQAGGESGKGKSAEAEGRSGGKAEHGGDKSRMGDKGDNDKMKSKSAEDTRKGKDHSKSAEQDRDKTKSNAGKQAGENKGMDNDKNRQAQDRDRNDKNKQAQDRDRNDRNKQAQDRDQNDRNKQAQDRDRNDRNKQAGNDRAGQNQGRVSFTSEQRTRFHDTIKTQKVRNERLNVNVSVGTRLPRDRVHLHALPSSFISVAPDYRRYRYAYIDDRYCIVDPDTYEIVYVVDDTGGGGMHRGGGQVASLDLTAHEKEIVLRHVDWDRRADLNIDLALGADIPDRVMLIDFSPSIVDEVPKLRGYRYVVLEKQVAIVDPKDREILLVIRD